MRSTAPDLPLLPDRDGERQHWHDRTIAWWETWLGSELARDFTAVDWSFLLDTALLRHLYWTTGQPKIAGEIRLREAKMGATPEDRARLRITFADADEKDDKREQRQSSARERVEERRARLTKA